MIKKMLENLQKEEIMGKKNYLLAGSIVISCLILLYGWFGDYLSDRIFPIDLLIFFGIFIGFFVCLIWALRRKSWCSLAVLIAGAFVFVFFPFREARVRTEFILYAKARDRVVEMVKEGEVSSDSYGSAKLPFAYGFTSSNGKIHIYQNNEEGTVVTFWVFCGMLSGTEELIYADGGEAQIKEELKSFYVESIEKLKDNWYYVKTL